MNTQCVIRGLKKEKIMDLIIGKTYKISHNRKGEFVGKIVSESPEWVTFELVSGNVEYASNSNVLHQGEQEKVRRAFCKFTLVE